MDIIHIFFLYLYYGVFSIVLIWFLHFTKKTTLVFNSGLDFSGLK